MWGTPVGVVSTFGGNPYGKDVRRGFVPLVAARLGSLASLLPRSRSDIRVFLPWDCDWFHGEGNV